MTAQRSPVGLVLGSHVPPEQIPSTSRLAEELGYGELWFAENLSGSPLHRLSRRLFRPWGTRWRYLELRELPTLLQGFSDFSSTTIGFSAAFVRSAVPQRAFAALDAAVIDRLVPQSWHYIVAAVARK